MSSHPCVAITGVGAVTAHGSGVEAMWQAAADGRPCPGVADDVRGLDVQDLALRAIREAVESAGLENPGSRTLLAFGTNVGRVSRMERTVARGRRPLSLTGLNQWADHAELARDVARNLDWPGPALAVTAACASGALAIGRAFDEIASGACDTAIAGAADEDTDFKRCGHERLGSASNSGVVRPFDADRDGTCFRPGAGFLALESLERCLARGARPLALLRGYGVGADVTSLTAPDPEGKGARTAMRAALEDSGLSPARIDHVQAHGTGTRLNDAIEAKALQETFGDALQNATVSADKGCLGHTYGACGALSAILLVLMMTRAATPPVCGCRNPDPECRLPLVLGSSLDKQPRVALCNSFGFGGTNVSLLLESYPIDPDEKELS